MADYLAHVPSSSPRARARFGLRSLIALRRQRRHLAGLSLQALDDIGISPRQALVEAARPTWDVPKNWRS